MPPGTALSDFAPPRSSTQNQAYLSCSRIATVWWWKSTPLSNCLYPFRWHTCTLWHHRCHDHL